MSNSPHTVSIHILDNDSLLNIFYLYQPFFLGEDENGFDRVRGGELLGWNQGRWWYSLAHVCQRWRNIVLGSASYLGLSLVCTNGTPVAKMLELSPPLPLTVNYHSENGITAEDEEGLLLSLEKRDRIRNFRLILPVRDLQRLVMAMDEEFPILEYLIVDRWAKDSTSLLLPETLQAPNLRHLFLGGFTCPIRSLLHPTAVGLVTVYLLMNHPSTFIQPDVLLRWISSMTQLENLGIIFTVRDHDVESQLTQTPITTHITLPNLRSFWFRGICVYFEAVVCRIVAPRLENMGIRFFEDFTFSVPRLVQFTNTTENLRYGNADIAFRDEEVVIYFHEADKRPFIVGVDWWPLNWQVSSMAQISDTHSQVYSAVEQLFLRYEVHSQSSEEVDRMEWRNLLRPFSNVKTLLVGDELVEQLSRCLRPEDGEPPLELLPKLQELAYFASPNTDDAFTLFIDARRNAGRPVTLVHPSTKRKRKPFVFSLFSRHHNNEQRSRE